MIRRTRHGDWRLGTPNKADVCQHSRLHIRPETQPIIGLQIMVDDVLAGDLVPVVEPIARMHIPGRKKLLHASLRTCPGQPNKSPSQAELTSSPADTSLRSRRHLCPSMDEVSSYDLVRSGGGAERKRPLLRHCSYCAKNCAIIALRPLLSWRQNCPR